MNNNKRKTINFVVAIQISILVIGFVAFTDMVGAQVSIAPLTTNVARKAVIESDSSIEESEDEISITGRMFLDWIPIPFIQKAGLRAGGGAKSIGLGASALGAAVGVTAAVWVLTLLLAAIFSGGDFEEALFWANAAAISVALGLVTGSFMGGLTSGLGLAGLATPVGWIVGGAIAIFTFIVSTMKVDQRAVLFDCKSWQSQTGGEYCTECNYGEFPCTEYKCKSLGQACLLKNEGDDAECIHEDPTDVASPQITPRIDSLLSDDYSYEPIPTTYGVEIKYKGDCLPSFASFTYGIELDKTGICRMAGRTTDSFENMTLPFGSGLWKRNHTQLMFFAGKTNLEAEGIELPSGGNYEYYVRCESVNGYANVDEFLFRFCIDPLPDTSQPIMQGFNLLDRTPIRWFSETDPHETDVIIYSNEPLFAETGGCKWSRNNQNYDDMEWDMESCGDSLSDLTTFNAQLSFSCSATLTGLQNNQENKFYFRCKDKEGNTNTISKTLTLIGSRPLSIDSVEPEGIIKGSSDKVKVTLAAKTSEGYEDGKADCYHSLTGDSNDYTRFTDTRSYTHSTDIYLEEDDYTYHIQCFDMAGNVDKKTINFKVESDFHEPIVVRAYYDNGDLNLITSEPAECVYDTTYVNSPCDYAFEDGISMSTGDDLTHFVNWNTDNNLYIKCQDEYGNQPINECSIILRPFEFF
jgi:hypothetical protein